MPLSTLLSCSKYHITTAFLFTKSDIKTTLIPVTVFAVASAPLSSISRLCHVIFWVWLHLLQFDVSNQTLDPEEDTHNKSYRPLPARRISTEQAVALRWILVPLCFALSGVYSMPVLYSSVALVILTVTYNELHAHAAHWAIRNIVNACGFASFEAGATLIAGNDADNLDSIGALAICISAGIFATSIHAQDFKDVEGDRLVGRRTLPLVSPQYARRTVIVILVIWSLLLSSIWKLDKITASVFVFMGTAVGVRFVFYKTIHDDQISFYLYNVWLSCAHALPGYWRLFG